MPFSKLDRADIVNEAIALLGEEGLAQISLRKIAARLDVTMSSLYWHIRDRDQLLAIMCESVFRDCLDGTSNADTWREWLVGFGRTLWEKQVSLRDCQRLIVTSALDDSVAGNLHAVATGHLVRLGVEEDHARTMQMSVHALVTGWSTLASGPQDAERFQAAMQTLVDGWAARFGLDMPSGASGR